MSSPGNLQERQAQPCPRSESAFLTQSPRDAHHQSLRRSLLYNTLAWRASASVLAGAHTVREPDRLSLGDAEMRVDKAEPEPSNEEIS